MEQWKLDVIRLLSIGRKSENMESYFGSLLSRLSCDEIAAYQRVHINM